MESTNDAGMRHKILQTAAALFTAHGYDGVSMRELSEACGLSKPGLYYYYTDKEALFLAVLEDHLSELSALLDRLEAQAGSAREKIAAFIHAVLVEFPAEQRAVTRLASQELGKLSEANRLSFNHQYEAHFTGRLAGLIAAGKSSGEFRPLDAQMSVWALLGLMYPFFNVRFPMKGMDSAAAAQLVKTVFFNGISAGNGAVR